jgi:S1-C subfamily serine protease
MTDGPGRRSRLGFAAAAARYGVLAVFVCGATATTERALASPSKGDIRTHGAEVHDVHSKPAGPQPGSATATVKRRPVVPSDDWTYRPTVLVRRGTSQGTGTIIASNDGETLILTAAHVVRDRGPILVELQRFNLGVERIAAPPGSWPRLVSAGVAASDAAADLAVLRIEKMRALPYVARLAHNAADPPAGSEVTSIGIDLGTELAAWTSPVVEILSFKLNDSREERQFLITDQIPEHGRSGGGLFGAGGELVGVCLGHAEILKGKRMGVFVSLESIRLLLDDRKLTAAIARSEARQARKPGRTARGTAVAGVPSRSSVTATRATSRKRSATPVDLD